MTQYGFFDVAAEEFPFTILFHRVDTGAVVHRIVVEGPGAVIVPALKNEYGVEMCVEMLPGVHPE